jgi:hypothetical protein
VYGQSGLETGSEGVEEEELAAGAAVETHCHIGNQVCLQCHRYPQLII